jgi:hypothetical protein
MEQKSHKKSWKEFLVFMMLTISGSYIHDPQNLKESNLI